MYNLSIIKATYCPLSEQLHDIALCEQFCDNFYEGCTEARLKQSCVMCPCINQLVDVGMCADNCDYYEGDGKDEEFMMCSYVECQKCKADTIGHYSKFEAINEWNDMNDR